MSKAPKNLKAKKGRFVGIPYEVARSKPFIDLRAPEVKLLFDLMCQYNGSNNGCLSPCHTLMRERGWAKSSLYRAFVNLEHSGFVTITRSGWKIRGIPTLVAVTWNPIDEPRNGVEYDDAISPSNIPLNYWCKAKASWKKTIKLAKEKKITLSNMEDKPRHLYPNLELVHGGRA